MGAVKLTMPDSHYLDAAEGWLGLGDGQSASDELDRISPAYRSHPGVLEVRYEIEARAGRWARCIDIAETLVKSCPRSSFGWIRRSFALHELKRTDEAFEKLLPVVKKFPKDWVIPYNLACYSAQLGRISDSGEWFKKALAIDEHAARRAALDDPDLVPLRASMGGLVRKPEE